MTFLLCRNRVKDFDTWKAVLDSHAEAHKKSGLHLASLWRGVDRQDDVFFLFAVSDMDKAREFISAPPAQDAAADAGVIEGEYHFVQSGPGY